jgi:hypothetical protein
MYIVNPSVGGTLMEFQLAVRGKQGYSVQKKDNIMNNGNKTAKLVTAEQTSSDRQGIMTRLTFEDKPESDKPLVLRAKMRSVKEHIVELEVETPEEELYYVYGKGGFGQHLDRPCTGSKARGFSDGSCSEPGPAVCMGERKSENTDYLEYRGYSGNYPDRLLG